MNGGKDVALQPLYHARQQTPRSSAGLQLPCAPPADSVRLSQEAGQRPQLRLIAFQQMTCIWGRGRLRPGPPAAGFGPLGPGLGTSMGSEHPQRPPVPDPFVAKRPPGPMRPPGQTVCADRWLRAMANPTLDLPHPRRSVWFRSASNEKHTWLSYTRTRSPRATLCVTITSPNRYAADQAMRPAPYTVPFSQLSHEGSMRYPFC